jgi:hypothetical protein
MQPIATTDVDLDDDSIERLVLAWRTEQLWRLGLSRTTAEAFAGLVDWHEVADLVTSGCSPELALEIVR